MQISHLKSFVYTYECKSMNRAAEKLFITQPAVSQHIKKLENALHVTLFSRTNSKLEPTPEGKLFYPYARKVLKTLDTAQEELLTYSRKNAYVDLYLFHYNTDTPITSVVSDFGNAHPEIELRLHSAERRDYINLANNMQEDCLYFLDFAWIDSPNVHCVELGRCGFHCIMREGHPLSEYSVLTLQDIRNETMLVPPNDSRSLRDILPAIRSVFPESQCKTSSNYMSSLITARITNDILIAPDYLPLLDGVTAVPYEPEHTLVLGLAYVGQTNPTMKIFIDFARHNV